MSIHPFPSSARLDLPAGARALLAPSYYAHMHLSWHTVFAGDKLVNSTAPLQYGDTRNIGCYQHEAMESHRSSA